MAPLARISFIVLTAGIAATFIGCRGLGDTTEPAFLINDSRAVLIVGVAMSRGMPNPGVERPLCRFDPRAQPITVGESKDAHARRDLGSWPTAELVDYDAETCSATIMLPPDKALLMFFNGTCSDDGRDPEKTGVMPTIQRLSITGGGRSMLLTGFDATNAFKVSASDGDCKFVIE